MTYQVMFSAIDQAAVEIAAQKNVARYYSNPENKGKGIKDPSINVVLELSRKQYLYADEGSAGAQIMESAMKDPRFAGLIQKIG